MPRTHGAQAKKNPQVKDRGLNPILGGNWRRRIHYSVAPENRMLYFDDE